MSGLRLSAAQRIGSNLLAQGKWKYDFLVTEANLYRARDVITVPIGNEMIPGDFVAADGTKATAPAQIVGIFCDYVNTIDGPRDALLVTRDAEVGDGYLMYGTMDAGQVADQLATLGIIVRPTVLPSSVNHGFGRPGFSTFAAGIAAPIQAEAVAPGIKPPDPQSGPPIRRYANQRVGSPEESTLSQPVGTAGPRR